MYSIYGVNTIISPFVYLFSAENVRLKEELQMKQAQVDKMVKMHTHLGLVDLVQPHTHAPEYVAQEFQCSCTAIPITLIGYGFV